MIRVGGKQSEVEGSNQSWRQEFRGGGERPEVEAVIRGGGKSSEVEGSHEMWRGAIRDAGERSEVEGSDQRWRKQSEVEGSNQRGGRAIRVKGAIRGGGARRGATSASHSPAAAGSDWGRGEPD